MDELRISARLLGRAVRADARRMLRDETGALAVEAAIILPLLAFSIFAINSYFQAFRNEVSLQRAGFTVGDMLSRYDTTVRASDIEGLNRIFEYLTGSEGRSWMRVSELQRVNGKLEVTWSHATGGNPKLTWARLQPKLHRIPTLAQNERVVAVETFTDYVPQFDMLSERRYENIVVTSQRYSDHLPFDDEIPDSEGDPAQEPNEPDDGTITDSSQP